MAALAEGRDDTWILACDEPSLPVHYPTINLLGFLQGDERWLSVGICQTGTPDDWLLLGELLARRGRRARSTRGAARVGRVVAPVLATSEVPPARDRRTRRTSPRPRPVSADEEVLARLLAGDHAAVIDGWAAFRGVSPEGFFAHYLMMVGAIGGRSCVAAGEMYSDYESAGGTGQAHVWFERPDAGWTS